MGCYSKPDRDPRGHTVSLVYVAEATGEPKALDDAKNLQVCLPDQAPEILVFDHAKILQDYLCYRKVNPLTPLYFGLTLNTQALSNLDLYGQFLMESGP